MGSAEVINNQPNLEDLSFDELRLAEAGAAVLRARDRWLQYVQEINRRAEVGPDAPLYGRLNGQVKRHAILIERDQNG